MPRNAAAKVLDLPKPALVKRHRMVLEFDSARDAKSFKAAFQTMWEKHETGFPGTLVFMSHEVVESK
jgi:hypothetical protein